MVAVDREGEETWIVDPLLLQPAQDLAVIFRREGFIVHSMEKAWMQKVVQKENGLYLAVNLASSFMYSPKDDWKIPK